MILRIVFKNIPKQATLGLFGFFSILFFLKLFLRTVFKIIENTIFGLVCLQLLKIVLYSKKQGEQKKNV